MKNIIVMSGDIGSGKSSVATALKQLTNFDIIGTGTIQRAIATKRGLTTLELNKFSQTDRSIDDEIDSYVIELGKTQDNLILDSRLAWHFIPAAFNASRNDEKNPSLDVTLQNNLKRQTIEDQRFNQLYNIHFRKYGNYDLIIDTSYTSPETIAKKIKDCFDAWSKQQFFSQLWVAPKKLLPTQSIKELIPDGSEEEQSVNVFVCNGFIYIKEGHLQTLAAQKAGVDLMPAKILTEDPDAELSPGLTARKLAENVSIAMLYKWEEALNFEYTIYP